MGRSMLRPYKVKNRRARRAVPVQSQKPEGTAFRARTKSKTGRHGVPCPYKVKTGGHGVPCPYKVKNRKARRSVPLRVVQKTSRYSQTITRPFCWLIRGATCPGRANTFCEYLF